MGIALQIIEIAKSTSVKNYLISLILTLITWVMYFFVVFLIAKSVNMEISLFYLIISMSITATITMVPISFNGLGTREATLLVLFSQLGINKETTILFSVLIFVWYVLSGAPGLIFFLIRPIKREKINEGDKN